MRTKNYYQINIIQYKKRRLLLRKKYNVINGYKPCIKYTQKVFKINRKILIWSRQLRKIRARERKIYKIDMLIKSFFGFRVNNAPVNKNRVKHISVMFFYKYGIESGCNGKDLATYTKVTRRVPAESRMRFTRSFQSTPENKEIWHRFKQFINQ